jgi:hypothetical protein
MFAVGGVQADGGRLRSSVPPLGWIEGVPNVVTWDIWDRFRTGWLGFGVPPQVLPEQNPLDTNYPVPVWTIATALFLLCAGGLGPGLSNEQLQTYLHICSVPVTVSRPSDDIATRFFDITHFACIDESVMVRGEHYAGR